MFPAKFEAQATVVEYDGFSGQVGATLVRDGLTYAVSFESKPFFGARIPRLGDSLKLKLGDQNNSKGESLVEFAAFA